MVRPDEISPAHALAICDEESLVQRAVVFQSEYHRVNQIVHVSRVAGAVPAFDEGHAPRAQIVHQTR